MSLFSNSVADLDETADEVIAGEPVETEEVEETVGTEGPETDELDEEESADGADESNEDESDVYIVDGEEFTAEQLQNAKDIKNMQADYTRKTMLLADDRKVLESKMDSLDKLAMELEVLVKDDEDVDWEKLKDEDIYEYTERKEKAELRAKRLKEVKSNLKVTEDEPSQDELVEEQRKLIEAFPHWVERNDDGTVKNTTQAYKDELATISKHAIELGFSESELGKLNSAAMIKALFNSLKSQEKKSKIEIVKKNTKPKPVKPAKQVVNQPTSLFNKSIKQG